MRVLLIKMSSLGDVVHALAAVTDAVRAKPGIQIDWVVEEAYQEIPRWHPAVNRVIPIALRRWRKSVWPMIRDKEWFRFRSELRRVRYDRVLDAQGLMKSAWIGRQSLGLLAGRDKKSARETFAAALYHRRYPIDLSLPEVEQLRQLFAKALEYPTPASAAEFGIDRSRIVKSGVERPFAVFVHGAAWRTKLWPEERWAALGSKIRGRGLRIVLSWGTEEERLRALRLAQEFGGEVLPRLEIVRLAGVLADAQFVVGLDTGLTHIAVALGTPALTLYGPTVPVFGQVVGNNSIHLTSSDSPAVDTRRENAVPLEKVITALDPWLQLGDSQTPRS